MVERNRNEIGRRYGRLIIISREPDDCRKAGRRRWLCVCDCGSFTIADQSRLRQGDKRSCGCINRELLKKNRPASKHGESRPATKEYRSWHAMLNRCYCKNHRDYKWYGACGIKVCEQWRHSYECFLGDVGRAPSSEHTLGRINNNDNYNRDNVRWETRLQQNNNKRNNRHITAEGKTHTISEWSRISKIPITTIWDRLKRGVNPARAVTVSSNRHEWNNYRNNPELSTS